MTAKLEITPGQRFGKLVALTPAPRLATSRHQIFQFKCDCGNEVVRAVSVVKRSRSPSCGCSRRKASETGYTGVIKNKRKYQAQIKRNGRKIYLGSFATAAEAAATYQRAKGDPSYRPPVRLKRNATGYTGVYVQGRKFRAAIWRDGRKIHVGLFTTAAEASAGYRRTKTQRNHHPPALARAAPENTQSARDRPTALRVSSPQQPRAVRTVDRSGPERA
jgi:hypothetical protein